MMITEVSQIKPGMTLFDTVNTNSYKDITQVTVVGETISHREMCDIEGIAFYNGDRMNTLRWVKLRDQRNHEKWSSLGDRGIESKHNNNRFFTTREEAEAHLKS